MAKLPGDSLPVSKKSKCRPWIVKVKNTGCGSKKVKAPAIVKAICDWKDKGTKGTKSSAQNSCLEVDISQPIQSRNPPNLIQSSKWLKRQIQNSVSQKICNSLPCISHFHIIFLIETQYCGPFSGFSRNHYFCGQLFHYGTEFLQDESIAWNNVFL